jgi:hypothetical protein
MTFLLYADSNIPTDGEEALCGDAHDEEGGPRHHDVLQGIPEVREHVHVGLNKRKKYNELWKPCFTPAV